MAQAQRGNRIHGSSSGFKNGASSGKGTERNPRPCSRGPKTKIFLRTGEARAAEWVSKCIGQIELEEVREARRKGSFAPESKSDSLHRKIEPAVIPSETATLPVLIVYPQTPGFTTEAQFSFVPSEEKHPGLVLGQKRRGITRTATARGRRQHWL
jgi:hypothetical protein